MPAFQLRPDRVESPTFLDEDQVSSPDHRLNRSVAVRSDRRLRNLIESKTPLVTKTAGLAGTFVGGARRTIGV